MKRREFICLASGAALSLPLPALAQGTGAKGAAAKGGATAMSDIKPAQAIADFVTGFDLKNVPPIVVERARIAFIDSIGVMIAGSHHEPTDLVCDMIKLEGSAPAATIVGRSVRASPQLAALANGVSNHALDYDFTYFAGQAIAGLIPAILPVAETTKASQAEVLSAFIIGAEVCGRLVRTAPTMFRLANWHATSTVGTIAAAMACARLMKAPAKSIPEIIGICTSLASGVTANFGTMTKPLHAGNAARNGVLAVQLGMKGFTGNSSALEGRNGFYDNFARGLAVSYEPFGDFGKRWDFEVQGPRLKPYPSGGLGHTAIDAALELRDLVKLEDVAGVEVAITKYALRRYTATYPVTVEAAKFSGPYIASYTLIHGAPMLPAFTEAALKDEKVRAFAPKVTLAAHPEHGDVLNESPARVTVTLKDGSKIARDKFHPTGSLQVPMSRARIEEKFTTCATTVIKPHAAAKILALLGKLGEEPSFDAFWPLVGQS